MQHYLRQLATRYTSLTSYQKLEDEEEQLLDQPSEKQPRGCLRSIKPSQTAVYLLLADLTLLAIVLYCLGPLFSLLRHNKEMFSAHVTISQDGVLKPVGQVDQIPRILHQTCKNDTIPPIWAESQQSCIDRYSDYEYKLWTDERARDFLAAEYPWFLDTWDTYVFPIQRADSIRYFVLYHFGGIYLDMDTICHEAFPMHQIETNLVHNSLFEATLPTGITNDIMISTARHPAFESAIKRLPSFHRLTRLWARLQPYAAIMMSTGPLFITLATADYLYGLPSLPSQTVQVINSTDLKPYIKDLQSATWHGKDAHVLKWLADKPFLWFILGTIGVVLGVYLLNKLLLLMYRVFVWVANSAFIGFLRFLRLSLRAWAKAY